MARPMCAGLLALLLAALDGTARPAHAGRDAAPRPAPGSRHTVTSGRPLPVRLAAPPSDVATADTLGQRLYGIACASCHGVDGRGAPPGRVAFDVPVPDFTDCSFSSREPDADWAAVVHAGGPVRAFDSTMPAFGEAFPEAEIAAILRYVRTFCGDPSWPRGELNVPRALFTEKAYPEDEMVATVAVGLEGPAAVSTVLLYEKRFGARNQIEVEAPFAYRDAAGGLDAQSGIGDIGVAIKRVLWHSLERGGILSAGTEVLLPTGDRDRGFGTGTVVFEPYLAFARLLPGDGFVQLQGLVELPADTEQAASEAAWRAAAGRSFTVGEFGRTWTPMIELLGSAALDGDSDMAWDVVPQFQVTLNTRQHVMANLGVRIPVTDADLRSAQFLAYILWDWFDGGFLDGW